MKPVVVIVEGATGVTGGFVAARREAELLRGVADVILVLPTASRIQPAQLAPFAEVVRLPIQPLRRNVASVLRYAPNLLIAGKALAKLLKNRRCMGLQVNDYYLMEGAIARLFGYRGLVATWVRIDPSLHGVAGRLWLKVTAAVSDEIVTVSEYLRTRLPKHFHPRVVYDAIPSLDQPRSGSRSSRFVFVGNFVEGKGQDLAIEAFERVSGDYPASELAFYGSDLGLDKNRAYLSRLRTRAKSSFADDRISFSGFVDDLAPVLDAAFAALNLSRSESFSLTCQEASAHGLAVIATRSGGPAEIIEDGVTGFLIPVGDVDAIAGRMRLLLEDHERAFEMGRRGAALVRERFSPARFLDDMIDILDLDR